MGRRRGVDERHQGHFVEHGREAQHRRGDGNGPAREVERELVGQFGRARELARRAPGRRGVDRVEQPDGEIGEALLLDRAVAAPGNVAGDDEAQQGRARIAPRAPCGEHRVFVNGTGWIGHWLMEGPAHGSVPTRLPSN
jgi:hypothetical protein